MCIARTGRICGLGDRYRGPCTSAFLFEAGSTWRCPRHPDALQWQSALVLQKLQQVAEKYGIADLVFANFQVRIFCTSSQRNTTLITLYSKHSKP